MIYYLIIILIALGWTLYKIGYKSDIVSHKYHLFFSVGISFYILFVLGQIIIPFISLDTLQFITDWSRTWGVAWLLVGLFLINRNDRPPVAQFPYFLVFIPLLIPFSYLPLHQTVFIKDLLVSLYEMAAIVASITIFMHHLLKKAESLFLLIASGLFLLTMILWWFPLFSSNLNNFLVYLMLIGGIILFSRGFNTYINSLQSKQLT